MAKESTLRRFGPGVWATIRETSEHVKVESWSDITGSYRVRSSKHGLLYPTDAELDEIEAHPDTHRGKEWRRCSNSACGAPLTPGLPICERCATPKCTCGRCECRRATAARKSRAAGPRAPRVKKK